MRERDADVVYGVRRSRAGETAFKRATAHGFYRLLSRATEVDIPLDAGDFRLISRRALDALLAMPEQARFIRGMVAWIGFRQVPFAYDRDVRFAGETKYPLSKMIRFALDALTGFSSAPLKLASHAGLALAALSVLLIRYIAYAWAAGQSIQGWTSLMLVVVILGAVQMFVLALMGEYIGRLYNEAKGRPLYIVQEIAGGETQQARLGYVAEATANSDSPAEAEHGRCPPLESEHPLQGLIEQGAAAWSRRCVLTAQFRRKPLPDGKREQQAVEITDPLQLQRRPVDQLLQRALRIAAVVVIDAVVSRPHPLVRRHRQEEPAAGLQPARDRCHRGGIVGDMFDHIEGCDEIVARVRDTFELR